MKKIKTYILLLLIVSCSVNDDLQFDDLQFDDPVNIPIYSATELIIQFKENVPLRKKVALRAEFGVISSDPCHCTDDAIEKWTFENDVDIENKKKLLDPDESGDIEEIKNVDYEFSFESEKIDFSTIKFPKFLNYQSVISTNNYGVTIAVLDTGLNVNYAGFSGQYLYNANNCNCETISGLPNQISGWDYVNEDNNTYDDHYSVHGTKVAYIMHRKMIADNIPHQILPLKIADNFGKISAFNLICGTKNAVQFADIVNMSLGYYSNGEDDKSKILEDIIINNNHVLFVTSAGNSNRDTEIFTHYPSSFPQENVVAIAAANKTGNRKAYFSNYGMESIDFYAIGENIQIEYLTDPISGTSYSAPYVSAIAAKLLFNNRMTLSPDMIIQKLDQVGTSIEQDGEKVKYEKIIR
ncbi:MAG: S8 family peptidase [Polaribacter sp.]